MSSSKEGHTDFHQKLERLTANENKSRIGREAGLPPNAINDYINRKNMPRADTALRIANALGVSLEWMLDPKQGFPPVKVERQGPDLMTNRELLFELAKRYRVEASEVLEWLDTAERTSWDEILEEIRQSDNALSESTEGAGRLALWLLAKGRYITVEFDINNASNLFHDSLPGSKERAVEAFDTRTIADRLQHLQSTTKIGEVASLVTLRLRNSENSK